MTDAPEISRSSKDNERLRGTMGNSQETTVREEVIPLGRAAYIAPRTFARLTRHHAAAVAGFTRPVAETELLCALNELILPEFPSAIVNSAIHNLH